MSLKSVLVVAIAVAVSLALAQTLTRQQEIARSNMKMLGMGLIMYQTDYDDVYPYPQETKSVFGVIFPYLKNVSLCKSQNAGSRVLFNMSLGGANMMDVAAPAGTIMFYDEKPWPGGQRLAVFTDGHSKFLNAAEWKDAEKTLHLKLKRKAVPLPKNYYKKMWLPKSIERLLDDL